MKEPVETPTISVSGSAEMVGHVSLLDTIAQAQHVIERDMIIEALVQCGGNAAHAAKMLKVSRRCLAYKIIEHGIKR